jgi:hypothetical protein
MFPSPVISAIPSHRCTMETASPSDGVSSRPWKFVASLWPKMNCPSTIELPTAVCYCAVKDNVQGILLRSYVRIANAVDKRKRANRWNTDIPIT